MFITIISRIIGQFIFVLTIVKLRTKSVGVIFKLNNCFRVVSDCKSQGISTVDKVKVIISLNVTHVIFYSRTGIQKVDELILYFVKNSL